MIKSFAFPILDSESRVVLFVECGVWYVDLQSVANLCVSSAAYRLFCLMSFRNRHTEETTTRTNK